MHIADILQYSLSALLLLVVELLYFRLATRYNIIDRPNERSSHIQPVIRGGGLIFGVAVLIWTLYSGFVWPWFVLGTVAIAAISFLDDVATLNPKVRFTIQLAAVLLLFDQLWPIAWPVYLLVLAIIVCIGTLNGFNFMDGVNGMTGVYATVTLITFAYLQVYEVSFTSISLIITVLISVLLFLFFNFRQRARSFAGDVGSVTIAFILVFLLLQLIQATHNFLWPLLFLVYGTEVIITIIQRLRRKENIFKAHRTHLYQYICNELGWSHRNVSMLYGGIQLLFNIIVMRSLMLHHYLFPLIAALVFVLGFVMIRIAVTRKIQTALKV